MRQMWRVILTLALLSTAVSADCPVGGSNACVSQLGAGLSTVSSSGLGVYAGSTCSASQYASAVSASGALTCAQPAGTATVLAAPVTCAVSASYCTIFSYTPGASKNIYLTAHIIIDTDSTTVAPQFRVSSADNGYTGRCSWELYAADVATTTAPIWVHTAMGTNPADTAGTVWGSVNPQPVELHCVLTSDASPGAVLIEWQLETGTSPTQTVLAGSYYVAVTN